jgi:hypothetical protein
LLYYNENLQLTPKITFNEIKKNESISLFFLIQSSKRGKKNIKFNIEYATDIYSQLIFEHTFDLWIISPVDILIQFNSFFYY